MVKKKETTKKENKFPENGMPKETEEATPADKLFYEELLNDVKEDFARRQNNRRPYETAWQLNMNFYMGNQYCNVNGRFELEQQEKYFFWQEREVFNHIAPIMETRLAKLNRVRPKMSVRPFSNDDGDINCAKLSSKLIESIVERQDFSGLTAHATMWSEICGTVFYKTAWDPKLGRKLGKRGEEDICEGDVNITVCPPFEIFPDSNAAAGIDECQSIIHARAYSAEDVKNIWGVDVKGESIKVFSLDGSGVTGGLGYNSTIPSITQEAKENHVIVIERYERPSPGFPYGRLIIAAGDKLLHVGDLPYMSTDNRQRIFPFCRQTSQSQPGCFWGSSIIERLIPIQRAYNAVKNRKHEFLNRLSMGVLTVEDGSVDTDNLEEEGLSPGKVLVYRQGSNPPRFMDNGSIPTDFIYEEGQLQNEFVMISGVSELMRNSATPRNVTSGVALQLLIEQDDTRLTATAEEIRKALRRLCKNILQLFKQFAKTPRIGNIAGDDGELEMFYFSASDLTSDDVVTETENEISVSPAQKKSMVLDLLQTGLLSDRQGKLTETAKVRVLEMMGFGNWTNSQDISQLHLKRAMEENISNLADLEVLEVDDHDIHMDEHTKFIIGGNGKKLTKKQMQLLLDHVRQHKQVASLAEQRKLMQLRELNQTAL